MPSTIQDDNIGTNSKEKASCNMAKQSCSSLTETKQLMGQEMSPFSRQDLLILMQDGDPANTAMATKEFFAMQFSTACNDWPGNSPDLNPVEHLWTRLQDSVLRQTRNCDDVIRRSKYRPSSYFVRNLSKRQRLRCL